LCPGVNSSIAQCAAPFNGSECHIQNMTYMIDTSGTMGGSRPYWLPISLRLVDFFNDAGVMIGDYTLIDYVPTSSITLTTSERSDFQTAISNITEFSGAYEATFEGLKFSLEQSPCYNYIIVFTDEIGNDVNNATLKNEIINVRDKKKSCIFFVVFEWNRGRIPWEQTFGDVGNVIQIEMESQPNSSQIQAKVDPAMKKILDGTKNCSVCQEETCSASSKPSSGCAPGWIFFRHTKKCYRVLPSKNTWYEAVKDCKSASLRPSSLVSITDKTTNNFLHSLAKDDEEYWTGGHQDSSHSWIWLDESKLTYFNWHIGEPNNAGASEDYLIFNYGGKGLWSDDPPSKFKRASLCQYDP